VIGASLATLALWVLYVEAVRTVGRPPRYERAWWIVAGGSFLMGLSTLQGEFDYGVPQFRQLYHPVLIMLAAGIGLVAVRVVGGRGAAVGAALVFLALRGTLTLIISVGLGRSVLHFPLYLPEAILVEVAALLISRERLLRFALVSGSLIGTVGLAAEWAWSHAWMPLPWHASLLPQAAVFGFLAAVAGGVIGGLIGRAVSDDPIRRVRVPVAVAVTAGVVAAFCIGYPLPMTANAGQSATLSLREVTPFPNRTVLPTVRMHPADAATDANWFTVTSWQGAGPGDGGLVISNLRPTSPGVYRADRPVPVYGQWKTLLRLQKGTEVQVVPIYMPYDPAIPAQLIPAFSHITRHFERDKKALQREAVGGSTALQDAAYALVALLASLWLTAFGWGLRRIRVTGLSLARRTVPESAKAA